MKNTLIETARSVLEKSASEQNFKNWFGNSVLKHDDGTPMKFYHGTPHDFHSFSYAHVGKGTDAYGTGFYLTNDTEQASHYATSQGHVIPVHVRLEHPIDADGEKSFTHHQIEKLIKSAPDHKESLTNFGDVDYHGYNKVLRDAVNSYTELPKLHALNALGNDFYRDAPDELLRNTIKHTGHDGVIVNFDNGKKIVNVFHPNQIKSSIGNSGEYSRKSDAITESLPDINEVVKGFRDKWNDRGVQNFAYPSNGKISLSQIIVPKGARNNGVGSMYMKELTDIADTHQHTITITPSSDFGGTKSRLVEFYKRHGFVENNGKSRDYSISDTMYRIPKTINETVEYQKEGWLHVEHRAPKLPKEHLADIISNHQKLGWTLATDPHILNRPFTRHPNGGIEKFVEMQKDNDNKVMLHVRFKYNEDKKHTDYLINREFRRLIHD